MLTHFVRLSFYDNFLFYYFLKQYILLEIITELYINFQYFPTLNLKYVTLYCKSTNQPRFIKNI